MFMLMEILKKERSLPYGESDLVGKDVVIAVMDIAF